MYKHCYGIFSVGGEEEGLRGWDYVGEISMEEFLMGEENFHEGGTGFLSIFKEQ